MTVGAIAIGVAGSVVAAGIMKVTGISGGGGGGQIIPQESPTTTLSYLKQETTHKSPTLSGNLATAKAVGKNSMDLNSTTDKAVDPWQNTRDWYTTLGGDKDTANNINAENSPF